MIRSTPRLFLLALATIASSCILVVSDKDGDDREERHDGRREGRREVRSEEVRWTILFDGSSTDAFRGFKQEGVPESWAIRDGALTRVGPGGDLITKEQFASFELTFEWKVAPGANSGVMFHVTEDQNAPYMTGPEYQILDNEAHADGADPRTSAAANYALDAPSADYTRLAGEWNQSKLRVDRGRVTHWLNGHQVVEYELWTDEWKAQVADSKFEQWPSYGLRERGHIVFQDHGDLVQYRDIKVRSLD